MGALVAGSLVLVALIVTLWPSPATRPDRPHDVSTARRCTPSTPCLAIVIDDVGREVRSLRRLLPTSLDITYAVLPHARGTAASVAALRMAGRQYLVHLPMQPHDSGKVTDEQVILGRDEPIERATLRCLAGVPGAFGVNNHMGSAFTEDARALGRLMKVIRAQGLSFLDSRTTATSRACAVARHHGVLCLERDLFLDDPHDPGKVGGRLRAATGIARRRGWAVAIGHLRAETVEALRRFEKTQPAQMVVRLSIVVREAGNRS